MGLCLSDVKVVGLPDVIVERDQFTILRATIAKSRFNSEKFQANVARKLGIGLSCEMRPASWFQAIKYLLDNSMCIVLW